MTTTAITTEEMNDLILIENVCTIDQDVYYEAVMSRWFTAKNILLLAFGIVLLIVGLLVSGRILLFLSFFVCVSVVCSKPLAGARDFRRLKHLHPSGVWKKTTTIYSDRVEVRTEAGKSSVTELTKVCRLRETEHLLILEFAKPLPAMILSKDGFTVGSVSLLRQLLSDAENLGSNLRASGLYNDRSW